MGISTRSLTSATSAANKARKRDKVLRTSPLRFALSVLTMKQIPTEEDWGDYHRGRIEDLDVAYAHDVFIGKSNTEMLREYKDHVLMRSEDLRWMPKKPFQYYIFGFRDYVMNGDFGFYESSDAASAFLGLILYKLKEQPDYILPVLEALFKDIEYIANNQAVYDADEDIYGNFKELLAEIKQYANGT